MLVYIPFVVVYLRHVNTYGIFCFYISTRYIFTLIFFQQGRTEKILNNLNPNFAKTFTVDYFFEEVQKLKFAVFDIDNETQSLGDDDFLGEVECTLGHVSIIDFNSTVL